MRNDGVKIVHLKFELRKTSKKEKKGKRGKKRERSEKTTCMRGTCSHLTSGRAGWSLRCP